VTATIRLRERVTTPGLSLTCAQRDCLRTQLRASIEPTLGSEGTYDVTPGNHIGALQVDRVTIVIEPKIPIARVLFLLGYAADPKAWQQQQAELGSEAGLVDGVVSLFTTLAARALQRGLHTGYHEIETDLSTVRGRIDIAEQVRRRPGLDLPLAVRFMEHDEDTTENRLLLAAGRMLRRLPVRSAHARRSLHRLDESLQNVSAVAYPPDQVPAVNWTRLNLHYRPAVELARLLLRLRSPDIVEGPTSTPGLVIDMSVLFEEFVRTALRETLSCSPLEFPPGGECPVLMLDAHRLVRIRPDLSYWPSGRCTFIGDVKYKRDNGAGHHDDLYQLLAYATAADLPDATLIYAYGPPVPRTHSIPGVDVQLHVQHLDLAKPPLEVLRDLATMAARIPAPAVSGRDGIV
jgi:5-methylcytosine-specific restriction enzyme subunit McrC